MKNYKIILAILAIVFITLFSISRFLLYIQSEKKILTDAVYSNQALMMKEKVHSIITSKQNSTLAIAISLASDTMFAQQVNNRNISKDYYTKLIKSLQRDTIYKNIWVQVLDDDLTSIYRSWSDKHGDNLKNIRKDLVNFKKTYQPAYSISVGVFDLSIKAIVPIMINEKMVGILEVISHFNSISKLLEDSNIYSVVMLNKQYSKQLLYPFSKLFIDGYYVANLEAREVFMQHLKTHDVAKHFNIDSYLLDDNYLCSSYELKSLDNRTLGYYLMFKDVNAISTVDLDFFILKKFMIALLTFVVISTLIFSLSYYLLKRQKLYYKNIVNSSTNIVVIKNEEGILDVNSSFFKYFYKYKTLDEFQKMHDGLSEFFEDEKGYISETIDGLLWIEYLLKNEKQSNKVKIKYEDNYYYFLVNVSIISSDKDEYTIVFTDITKEEDYKKKLKQLSITDPLTNISNRRFFDKSISREISNAQRYIHPLSLVMLDIDFFKKVNDQHGHKIGDEVLIEYTHLISSMLRDNDIFCRIGGEEFIIILPHVGINSAKIIAEKLRYKVESHKKILAITMSFGVTEYMDGDDEDKFTDRADKALYMAKNNGRNKVESI